MAVVNVIQLSGLIIKSLMLMLIKLITAFFHKVVLWKNLLNYKI